MIKVDYNQLKTLVENEFAFWMKSERNHGATEPWLLKNGRVYKGNGQSLLVQMVAMIN